MTLEELIGMANDPKPMPGTLTDLKASARLMLPECLHNRIDWREDDFESFDPSQINLGSHDIAINVHGGEIIVSFHFFYGLGWILSMLPFTVFQPDNMAKKYKQNELPQALAAAIAEGYKLSH